MRIIGNGRMITRDESNAFYENGAVAMDGNTITTVSYTHLRAHETGRNLVCRLLLEKKKKQI